MSILNAHTKFVSLKIHAFFFVYFPRLYFAYFVLLILQRSNHSIFPISLLCQLYTFVICKRERRLEAVGKDHPRVTCCRSSISGEARRALVPSGVWCSGITFALHAKGPGFETRRLHYLFLFASNKTVNEEIFLFNIEFKMENNIVIIYTKNKKLF